MKIRIISKFIVLAFLVTFIACSSKPKKSRKPVSQIKIENRQNKLVFGQTLTFAVNTKLHEGELDKTRVFIDNKLIKTTTEVSFEHKIENYPTVGKHTIKVVASKKDGKVGINYKGFEVTSDIVPEQLTYKVINTYPHNKDHFTEGLEIKDGFLYESTGENGTSGIYKMKLKTAEILQSVDLDEKYFGEGMTIFNDKIYQLTYHAQKGFIYDLKSFEQIGDFAFDSKQGWGMTHDNEHLIMGDGTHTLTYLNPETLEKVKTLQVSNNKGVITYLNELEYVDGVIYANVWTTQAIVKIDAETGKVLAEIDFSGLIPTYNPNEKLNYLNGIAVDPDTGKMYITGKWWPKIYEIELVKK